MKINWKQKLSSRKFWLALTGFITSILFLFNIAETDVETITGIIMSGASLIAYILAEGFVDGNRTIEIYEPEIKSNPMGFIVDNDEE